MKLYWTKEAITRLKDIEQYIAKDNQVTAIDFIDKLISLAGTIVDHPEKGRVVPELSIENICELLYHNYRIVYLVKKKSIDILTVFEGHKLLNKEEITNREN